MEADINQLSNDYQNFNVQTEDEKLATQFEELAASNTQLSSNRATHRTFGVMLPTSAKTDKKPIFELHREGSKNAQHSLTFAERQIEKEKSSEEGEGWGDLAETTISEHHQFGFTSILSSEHLGLGHMRIHPDQYSKRNWYNLNGPSDSSDLDDESSFCQGEEKEENKVKSDFGFAKYANNQKHFGQDVYSLMNQGCLFFDESGKALITSGEYLFCFPGVSYKRLMDHNDDFIDENGTKMVYPPKKLGSSSVNNDTGQGEQSGPKHHPDTLKDVEIHAKVTFFVYFSAIVVAIGGFLFGYDTGVISSAMLLIEQDFSMTAFEKGMLVGATTIGAFFGGLVAGLMSDTIGRRITSIIAALIFIGGACIMAFAHNYAFLVVGRLVVGLGVGLASMVVPIYISEISPRYFRGQLVTLNVLLITGGQVIAYLVGIAFIETGEGWRWMVGVSAFPAIVQLFGMLFVPESPRYLVLNAKPEQAKNVLRKIYPNAPQSFLDEEIATIQDTLAEVTAGSYADLFRYPNTRLMIIACGLQAIQQLSGFDTAMYYGGTIMRMTGFTTIKSATIFAVLVALTNFFMTAIALYIVDKIGRRRILLYTMIGMIIGLVILGISFIYITGFVNRQDECIDYGSRCGPCLHDHRCVFKFPEKVCAAKPSKHNPATSEYYEICPDKKQYGTYLALASLVFYVATYALGLGHCPWLIQSELFPLNIRGRATGIATATNWMCNLAVAVSFLPLTELITTTGTFWVYALIMILGWIFIFKLVPETAGKSLEEVHEIFE
ncbi:1812_t:CDS:10 [Ambispora gerdemannii]|uniref:1812_t:CDS:1 n=1 Tax=Ambispora gerdemannii TaxID=144530 RepID=A0A9N8Z9H9_9GLOM|nr:1812_t:CDS:10 [Ambispora gerdemannii]